MRRTSSFVALQEAFVARQAGSFAAAADLQLGENIAQVSIADDGAGFDADQAPVEDDRPHFGLKIMQARAARLNGRLALHTAPGQGTTVVLEWPVEGSSNHV